MGGIYYFIKKNKIQKSASDKKYFKYFENILFSEWKVNKIVNRGIFAL